MLKRAALGCWVALAALAGPAFGQAALQWKLKEGDKFYLEELVVSKTTTTAAGQKNTVEQTQVRISAFVVKKRTADTLELEQRIDSWKTKVAGALPGADEGARLLEEIARDVVFTIHLKPSGEITRLEGFDQVMKKADHMEKDEARKFKAVISEELFRSALQTVFDVLPAKAVKKGETWKKEYAVPLGPMGTYKYSTTYTDQGPGEGGEHASSKGTFTFEPAKANADDVGFKFIKLDLTQSEMIGTMIFDPARGRLVSNAWTRQEAGTLTVDRRGEQTVYVFEGTETRTNRLSEKKPQPDP